MFQIPSLYQLSAQSVANYFIDGRYNHLDFVLNPKFSDKIFSLLKDNEKIYSTDILSQFSTKFALTNLDLTKVPISSEVTKMISTQNLEYISFGPISKNDKEKENKGDVGSLIMESLNGVSRKQLRGLKVYKWEHLQMRTKLAKLLPSLETLDLSGSPIKPYEFLIICHKFPNLKTLNIGGFGEASDLKGISNLKNLEVLSLSSIKFDSHERLKDLSYYSNLAFPSVCQENIMEKYLECGKVLEELQFLDCSGTDIDKSMVENLIATHKNLKQVAVLNTIIDFSVFPGINLLNCATAESILEALNYYTKIGSRSIITHILDHIHSDYLQLFDKEKHGHLLEKFLKSVCITIEKFKEDKDICQGGIFCLAEIGKESVIKLLRPSSRYHLINQLLELGPKWLKSTFGFAHVLVIRALDEPSVLNQIPSSKVKKLCEYAINCLAQFYYAPVDPKNELSLLKKCWETMSFSEHLELYKLPKFEKYLELFILFVLSREREYLETHRKDLGFVLDVLCEMSDRNEGTCPPQTLVDMYKRYPIEWVERSKCIEIMANMRRNNRLRNEFSQLFLEEREFFMVLLDANLNGADQAFHVMAILSFIMTSPWAPQAYKNNWITINENMMKLGRNFPIHQVSARVFEPFLRDNILRNVLRSSRNENGGAVMWVLIVIQGILLDKNQQNKEILIKMGLFNALQWVKAKGIGKYGKKIAELLMNPYFFVF